MYRSNRSFNIPPPRAYPGHLTPLPSRRGGNLIIRVRGWGIWSPWVRGVAAISAALQENFVRSKYANSVSQFLLYWMRILCCIYKAFVRQLKAFLPSFCNLCACGMSPGWGHLITLLDPSVEHLNGILARAGGNLNNNFQKSQMPGGLPGGACWSFDLTDT